MICLILFITFFKIGAFTFGGGYAMLPLIQAEVLKNQWLPQDELINFIAVSESTPGPFAVNISTYVGMQTGGLLGAFCATLGVVLPSFIIILIVARFFERFQSSPVIKGIMSGLKPAVIGLIGTAVLSTAHTVFLPEAITLWSDLTAQLFSMQGLCCAAILLITTFCAIKKVHPIRIIALSAALGLFSGFCLL